MHVNDALITIQALKFKLTYLWPEHFLFQMSISACAQTTCFLSHIFKLRSANKKYTIQNELMYPCSKF